MERFPLFDRRFGLFVHWGIYAVNAWQEQELGRLNADRARYAALAGEFNPTRFAPDAWIDQAQAAGMTYMVFTAKHHDGFCMWDTKATDHNIMNTPYGKDALRLLADACARRNFPLGLYYSNPDWHHPDAYNEKSTHQMPPLAGARDFGRYQDFVSRQITELLTGYGKIVCLFWDIPPHEDNPALQNLARELMPGIWINDRGWGPGDYATPERTLPGDKPYEGNVEACQSVGRESWGYRANEDYYSASFLKKSVAEYLLRGGNYLLNVGPMADGAFPPESVALLADVGKWFCAAREALRAEWRPELAQEAFTVTRAPGADYLIFMPPVTRTGYAVPHIETLPARVTLLNTGAPLRFEIERFPTRHNAHAGRILPDCLHVFGLPVDALSEPLVVKIER